MKIFNIYFLLEMTQKTELVKDYFKYYTDNEKRISLCQHILNKYRFEKYSMRDNNINEDDYIVKGQLRNTIESIINSGNCTETNLKKILDSIEYDDLIYIGI